MNIVFKRVMIRISEVQTQDCMVAAWEVPVLQAVWGSSLEVLGDVVVEKAIPIVTGKRCS